jgi:hypothetical protein
MFLFLTVATVSISFHVLQQQGAADSTGLSPTRSNLFFDSVRNPTMNQDTLPQEPEEQTKLKLTG